MGIHYTTSCNMSQNKALNEPIRQLANANVGHIVTENNKNICSVIILL